MDNTQIPKLQKAQADREEKAKIARVVKAGLNNDYRDVFSTPAGVRVLNDLLSITHIFQTSFSFTGNDQIGFREGERNIGLAIVKKMNQINQKALFDAFKINLISEYTKK